MSLYYPFFAGIATQGNGFAMTGNVAVSASTMAFVQLFNPAGSGKTILVNNIGVVLSSGSSNIAVRAGLPLQSGTGLSITNKFSGSGNTSVASGVEGAISSLGGANLALYFTGQVVTNIIQAGDAIVLSPGTGIVVYCTTVNLNMLAGIQWSEINI